MEKCISAKQIIDNIIIKNKIPDLGETKVLQNYFYDQSIGNKIFVDFIEKYTTDLILQYGNTSENFRVLKKILKQPRRYFKEDPFMSFIKI